MDASTLTRLVRNRALISNTYTKVPGVPSEVVMERAVGRQAFIQDKKLVQGCCGTSGPTLGPVVQSMIITFGGSPPPPPEEEPTRGLTRTMVFNPDTLYVILKNAFGNIVAPDGTIIPVDILGSTDTFPIPGITEGDEVTFKFATVETIRIYGAINNVMDVSVYDMPNIDGIIFDSDFDTEGVFNPSTVNSITFNSPLPSLRNLQFNYVNTLFTTLDVTNIANLTTMHVGFDGYPGTGLSGTNQLNTITPSLQTLTDITELHLVGCMFMALDVSVLSSLVRFRCSNNVLTSLVLPTADILTDFTCYGNSSLSTITNLSTSTKLNILNVNNCNLSGTLDVHLNTGLEILDCRNNPGITGVNITGLTSLRELDVSDCTFSPAGTLNVTTNTGLEILQCNNNPGITGVNITGLTSLRGLYVNECTFSPAGTLNVTTNTGLEILQCNNNPGITGVDITGLTSLRELIVSDCIFSPAGTLNVTTNTGLEILDCRNNPGITGVNITGLTSLLELYVSGCTFSPAGTLDVHLNTGLEILECNNNPGITGVDITGLTSLVELYINNCTFSPAYTLDLHLNTGLRFLECSNNPNLIGLNINGITTLSQIFIVSCNLSGTLDVSDNIALELIICRNNPNLTEVILPSSSLLNEIQCNNTGIDQTGADGIVSALVNNNVGPYGQLIIRQTLPYPVIVDPNTGYWNILKGAPYFWTIG